MARKKSAKRRRNDMRKVLIFLLIILFIIGAVYYWKTEDQPISSPPYDSGLLRVHFIDVGQGDSIFLQLPNGEDMLIDAGPTDAREIVVNYLQSLDVGEIEYVVATHAHEDHIGGMAYVLQHFTPGIFYTSYTEASNKTYLNMLAAVDKTGLPVTHVAAGFDILRTEDLSVRVLSPSVFDSGNENQNSVIIRVVYGETSFLFTGDAEKKAENAILESVQADVLKVGHHGSSTSSAANFLKRVQPIYAIISVGDGNTYGHPTQKTLSALAKIQAIVYRTDFCGTIIIDSDGAGYQIYTERNAPEYAAAA